MNAADAIIETTENQRIAADPARSAFVSANAGAGKTRVLTNRVARLLLEGVDPSTILCITFTKAAAAEMADRLFKLLGGWALAEDAKLQTDLADLDGNESVRSPAALARARRLFARALETPGGLKIQTIHSFCESILHRFPIEAGVTPGFAVIEELGARALKREAIDRVARSDAPRNAEAFSTLLERVSGAQLREFLDDAMTGRRLFARADIIGWPALGDEAAAALLAPHIAPGDAIPDLTPADYADLLLDRIDETRLRAALELFDVVGGNPKRYFSEPLHQFFKSADPFERVKALTKVFLTGSGDLRKSFGTKATIAEDPSLEDFMMSTQARFAADLDLLRAVEAASDTRAFYQIVERCLLAYDALKNERAALDFDDLIVKARDLLKARGGAAWVLYKLDSGLDHILLDEAQDTGPQAWDVIEAPLEEFFSGAGVRERNRTFFAVGDQKQSIYSFQGADAALFQEKESGIGKKISAAYAYSNVPLNASFRTTAPILDFVDALFEPDEVKAHVTTDARIRHLCTREGAAGLVELWPLTPKPEKAPPVPWDAPLDAAPADNPSRKLAREIAVTIAKWLADGEQLPSRGRPIEAGDIMILVQSRGARSRSALFTETIRALGEAGVPVAGADRFKLTDDQAVLDLLSYSRTVLFDGDDLSLAELLKSPFFNVDEDSLYDLAANRTEARLVSALRARKDERPEWRRAYDEINEARRIGLEEGAVAMFTHILESGAPSGWRRLFERLGEPCREAVEEFLRQAHDFELRQPRSLRLFLDSVLKAGAGVSREGSELGSSVRVMTAHKAKGLESNIVFLVDAHRQPAISKAVPLLTIAGPHGDRLPVLALGDAKKGSTLDAALERARRLMRDEYRRLLYVAATRARDRLYICGVESGRGDPRKPNLSAQSWRALAEGAFERMADAGTFAIEQAGERFSQPVLRLSSAQTAAPKPDAPAAAAPTSTIEMPFLHLPAPAEKRAVIFNPSRLPGGKPRPAYSPLRQRQAFQRGVVLHKLLEVLPDINASERVAVAERLLARYSAEFDAAERGMMRDEVMRIIDGPQFSEVFAPGGRAETVVRGAPAALGGLLVSGQIDRMAVLEDRVLIVDYKTNRPPPQLVEDTPEAYIIQMASYRALLQEIYPGRKVEAALLWTFDARLTPLPDAMLDAAVRRIVTLR